MIRYQIFFFSVFYSLWRKFYVSDLLNSFQVIKKSLRHNAKNIHYMHMEYENVVLKGPTTDYEHGRKESVRTITETRNCTDGRRKTIRFRLNTLMLPKNPVNNCL